MAQSVLLAVVLCIVNHIAIGLVRAEIRSQHIKKYHYDYYEQRPKATNHKLWHNFKNVIFDWTTIIISMILSGFIVSILFL